MTSYMTIMVRVVSNRAQAQLAALRAQQAGLTSGIASANRQTPLGSRHITSLMKFGNQLQWTGRMLQYNFTLPIAAAGIAATHFAMEQEKAFTHVAKVYGDTEAAAKQFRKEMGLGRAEAMKLAEAYRTDELEALDDAFTAISNHYGVQKKEVLEVAGAWAAAGASGRDLAESVNQTMQAIIIGDMDAMAATKSLISIQAQYNLSTKELQATLANLNSVENQTGASMSDLIIGFEKAAGVARSAGVETEQLAAYMAALVPATGSAATAGNALKTIISRLMAPTKEATQVMDAMGLNISALEWQSSTATERLDLMAKKFDELGAAGQGVAASVIASRWQVNKFEVLMRELVSTTGYYQKALDAAENQGDSFTRMQRELNTVLESDPRRLQRMWVMLQNASVEIIQPLIPFILYLADSVADLANGFANMNPHVQKLILLGLVLLALIGPVIRYMGALYTLTGVVGHGFVLMAAGIGKVLGVVGMLFTPFKMLGTLVMGTLGLIGSGLNALVLAYIGGLARLGGLAIASTGQIMAAVGAVWRAAWLMMALVQTGAIGGMVKSWVAGLVLMGRSTSIFSKAVMLIQSAMAAFSVLFSRQFFLPMLMALANFTTIFTAAWATFWGWVKYYMVSVQLAMAGAWATFRVTFLAGWAGIHVGMMAVGAAFQKAWIALQVGMYRAWTAVVAVGNAAVATIERGWLAIRATLATAGRAVLIAIETAFWRTLLTIYAVGSRGIMLIWSLMSKNLIKMAISMGTKLLAVMTGPWGIAIAIIAGIMWAFRDQLAQIWNNIVESFNSGGGGIVGIFQAIGDGIMSAFNMLPQGVQNVMVSVVTIIRDAALAVYDWFSYINPFAHHSPSLVENVSNGMAAVNKSFASLSNIKKYTSAAYAEIKRFGQLTAQLGISASAAEQAANRATLKKAGAGQALGSYNRLIGILNKLTPILKQLETRINAQQAVVDRWQAKVDAANRALERQQDKLDDLQGTLDKYQAKLDEAQYALNYYANAPLKGMQEMEDQIFANQMAQTKLRLEIMKFEDTFGTYDELKSKIDAINGAQEILRGTQSELRAAGAGSEILSQYDDEMAKLDQQKDKYAEAADKLADMQAQLELLQREAERLDLVKAMKFDKLQYEIEKAANSMEELSFEEIMEGIKKANEQIDKYGPKVDQASAAVDRQQKVVDKLTAARDRLQDRLDKEQAILDRLQEKYDKVNGAISAINDSINDVISSADKMNSALAGGKKGDKAGPGSEYISPGLQNFLNAGNADFPDPGGLGIPPRTDWSNQTADIEKFTEQLGMDTAAMFESLNPFAPLKDKALAAWNWIKDKAKIAAGEVGDFFSSAFDGVSFGGGGGFSKFFDSLENIGEFLTGMFKDIAKVFKWAWDLLGPDIIKIGKGIWDGLKSIWEEVGPEIAKFGDLIAPMGEALKNLWNFMKPVLAVIAGTILAVAKVILSAIGETIGPVLKNIGEVLAGVIRVIRGIFEVIIGILTGDWQMAWDGVKDIVSGTFKAIWGIIKGAVNLIVKPIWGMIKGIVGFFKWLWDVLVGHSIIPDLVEGIKFWFGKLAVLAKWVWDNVVQPVVRFFKSLFDKVIAGVKLWWAGLQIAWSLLKSAGTWMWNNVLQPIWSGFKAVWDNFIKPALSLWWSGVKAAWKMLKTAGKWVWDNVLEPVWDRFQKVWKDHIKPFLRDWWAGVKVVWSKLKQAGIWLWENMLKPAWERVKDLWAKIGPELREWWNRIKAIWAALKAAGKWIWDNVLNPVWTKVKDLWGKVGPELREWWGRIKSIWNSLKEAGQWIKTNVMDPIFNKIKEVWGNIKTWLTNNKDMLLGPMKGIVNGMISAVNTIINGLNKVADVLPGIDWEITPIQKLARGGPMQQRRANRGFKTNGARAIVGEGKANWPEFVIPTDPTHRSRARGLLAMAAAKIGVGTGGRAAGVRNTRHTDADGVPMFGIGGWLDDKWGDVKDLGGKLANQLEDLGKHAIGTIMNPLLNAAENTIDGIGWQPVESPPLYVIDKVRGWVEDSDANLAEYVEAAQEAGGKVPTPPNPGSRTVWKGGTFTNLFIAHMKAAEKRAGASVSVMQGGFRPRTSYSGTSHQGDAVDFQVNNALIRAFRYVGIAAGDRTGLGDWGPHVHAVPGPKTGHGAGSAIWQYQDYMARGGASQPLNSPWGLREGAIIKARRGGVLANIGEGTYDEAVVPLPKDWRSGLFSQGVGGTENHYHFYGDLEFPNVTNGDDAKTFLENLETLAKD